MKRFARWLVGVLAAFLLVACVAPVPVPDRHSVRFTPYNWTVANSQRPRWARAAANGL